MMGQSMITTSSVGHSVIGNGIFTDDKVQYRYLSYYPGTNQDATLSLTTGSEFVPNIDGMKKPYIILLNTKIGRLCGFLNEEFTWEYPSYTTVTTKFYLKSNGALRVKNTSADGTNYSMETGSTRTVIVIDLG